MFTVRHPLLPNQSPSEPRSDSPVVLPVRSPPVSEVPDEVVPPAIGVWSAIATWATAWAVGTLFVLPVALLAAGGSLDTDPTIPQLAVAMLGVWAVFVAAIVLASRRFGTGDVLADVGVSFRPIDLLGLPVGVGAQLLLPALYWPLRELWPETFSSARLEERAQDLADRAGGFDTVLLALVVVVGAPLIEEVVYRGLIQRSLTRAASRGAGLLLTSALFALVHLAPVEYPGLFVAGLVFGLGVAITGRIGPAIVTHAAFNAAGLVIVLNG